MKNILIIKHGALGDVVLSMNAIFSIYHHFNKTNITVLTDSKYAEIFKKIPFIKNIKIDNRPSYFFFLDHFKLIYWFYNNKFDWVFDLQTSKRTNIYFFIFSLFKKFNWSGIAKKCSHPHLANNRKKLHTIDRQKEQLKLAGINKFVQPNWSFLNLNFSKFKKNKPYAIIVPGGSKHRLNKRWNFAYFLEIIKFLDNLDLKIFLIGGKDENTILQDSKINYDSVINLIGKTSLNEIAALAKGAQVILGNDTGPMHLLVVNSSKKALKIVLFGSGSNPNLCSPRGENVLIVKKNNINDIKPNFIKKIINKKNYSKK